MNTFKRNIYQKFIGGLFLLSLSLKSQEPQITKMCESSSVKLAYHNSFLYPGIRTGIELPFSRITKNKSKAKGKTKTIVKLRYFTTQLSWYYHPGFHTNYYLTVGGLFRRTKSSGFFTQCSFEAGYSRTFLAGTTYVVAENENVGQEKFAGNNYFAWQLGAGFGYDLNQRKAKPFKIYLTGHALFLTPYNSSVYPRAILEMGVIYTPKKFLSVNVRSKTKSNSR